MKRRHFAGLVTTAALAGSLLLTGVNSAAAAPDSSATATADARGGIGGATPNAKLPLLIQVDDKANNIVATLRGVGVQVYTCGADGKFPAAPREPVATLQNPRGSTVGIHGRGPFWAAFDGSKVVGTSVASVASPAGPSNVTWVKLSGASEPGAPGLFGKVTFIQRIDTRGGSAPSTPCTPGSTRAVDYSTNYVFWAAK